MRKEITICDRCGREIHQNEKYVQRPKSLSSNGISAMEDICIDCAYRSMNNIWSTTRSHIARL